MPAAHEGCRALRRPAYENLQGKKPRARRVRLCREGAAGERAAGAMGIWRRRIERLGARRAIDGERWGGWRAGVICVRGARLDQWGKIGERELASMAYCCERDRGRSRTS